MESNPFQTRSRLYRTPFKDDAHSQHDNSCESDAATTLSASSSTSSFGAPYYPSPTSTDLATLDTIPLHQPQPSSLDICFDSHRHGNAANNSQKRARERAPHKSPEFSLSLSSTSSNDSLINDKRFMPNYVSGNSSDHDDDADVGGNIDVGRSDSVWSLGGLSASLPPAPVVNSSKSLRTSIASSVATAIEDETDAEGNMSFSMPPALEFSGLRAHTLAIENAYKELYNQKRAAEATVQKCQERTKHAEDALKAHEQSASEAASMSKQKDKKIASLEFDLENTRELYRAQRRIVDSQSEEITKLRNKVSELKLEVSTAPQHAVKSRLVEQPKAQFVAAAVVEPKSAAENSSAVKKHSDDAKSKVVRVALKEKNTKKVTQCVDKDGINWQELASSGKMSSLYVVQLDKYLRRNDLPVTGRKAIKVERILTHLCS